MQNEKENKRANSTDLHIHTTISDSTCTPEEVVQKANKLGLKAIGITDHDTMHGIERARMEAQKYGLEIIPGSELTAYYNDIEIHLLAYYIDPGNGYFNDYLKKFRETRIERAKQIIKRLEDLGVKVDFKKIAEANGTESIGRPHIAREVVNRGYEKTTDAVFKKYISNDGPAYVPKFMIHPKEVINIILLSGGVPVLAHPAFYFNTDTIITKLIDFGLCGIEAYHPLHSKELTQKFLKLAQKYSLVVTGGSDCHGIAINHLKMGSVSVPYSIVKKLRDERDRIRSTHKIRTQ